MRTASASSFVNLLESEADPEQPVLLADSPGAGKAETLAQQEHGFENLDRAVHYVERAEASDPGHVLLDSQLIALDALLCIFRKNRLAASRSRLAVSRTSTGLPYLSMAR